MVVDRVAATGWLPAWADAAARVSGQCKVFICLYLTLSLVLAPGM